MVLLLGPLYHLTERADRERVLAEALRVVRPGGLVVAAGIQRYAALFDHAAHGRLHLDGREERSGRVLATGRNEGREFTFAYFHRAEELAEEVRDAGVAGTRLYGVEGPGDALLKAAETATGRQVPRGSDLFTSALAAAGSGRTLVAGVALAGVPRGGGPELTVDAAVVSHAVQGRGGQEEEDEEDREVVHRCVHVLHSPPGGGHAAVAGPSATLELLPRLRHTGRHAEKRGRRAAGRRASL